MASASLPFTLTAGQPENVNQLNANLNALLAGVNAVDTSQLDSSSVLVPAGLTGGGVTRRGVIATATAQNTTSSSYTTLSTADQVSNVVLPSNGILVVGFHGTWSETVSGAARAAIFIGSNQLKVSTTAGGAPVVQEAATGGATSSADYLLGTSTIGLIGQGQTSAYSGNVTTGQLIGTSLAGSGIGAGLSYIFAAAGTYTVSVKFKTSSGTVSAKNRCLWVATMGF